MVQYRRIRVDIYPGRSQALIAVTAETVRQGRRDVRLVHRGVADVVDASTVAALLRVAGDECHDGADRLI